MSLNDQVMKAIQATMEMEIDEEQLLLENLEALEALVRDKTNSYMGMFVPKHRHEEVNVEKIVSTIVVNCYKWTPQFKMISDPRDHEAWLDSSRKKNREYWDSYKDQLSSALDEDAVDSLDEVTDEILGQLEDPTRKGSWDRRGLVVGHVQSGKTGNYNGLIAKAADAGYKIIIVLAGLHNNLRAQTQIRLESGFLGYETDKDGRTGNYIGVGKYRDFSCKPNTGTNRSERGDFGKTSAKSISGITPESQPWLFVVKKNKSVLEHIIRWLDKTVSDSIDKDTGRKVVTKLPLLIIDDEADNASIDTSEQNITQDGVVDEEHNPTTINRLIRQILHRFSKKAYVGYTATPFANIFIHNKSETINEGKDLFPTSFIVNLKAPSNYVGPSTVFSEGGQRHFIREVSDNIDNFDNSQYGWMPNGHKSSHTPLYCDEEVLPPSLKEAIQSFLLASSVRYLRGDRNEHSSMLIHVTRFNDVQSLVVEQVNKYLKSIRQRLERSIGQEYLIKEFKALWENDFCKTTNEIVPSDDPQKCEEIKKKYFIDGLPQWGEVLKVIQDVVGDISVLTINGKAKEALEYEEHKKLGLKVIAIGGDKLSRGLTLEGLSTSYFLRASKMYDTLMQMGRWFGYRPRYFDLCRLYTSSDLVDWFSKIAVANEELREEFDIMTSEGMYPYEFGLKVQSHPGLLVTSPMKMRTSTTLRLSFSGNTAETVVFSNDELVIDNNNRAMEELISSIKHHKVDESKYKYNNENFNGYLFNKVNSIDVINFLETYKTHTDSYKSNSDLLSSFIEQMNVAGELKEWTVALVSGSTSNNKIDIDSLPINITRRKPNYKDLQKTSIGRLLDPKHELIDVSEEQYLDAMDKTIFDYHEGKTRHKDKPTSPSNSLIRYIKGYGGKRSNSSKEKGLLILYALELRGKDETPSGVIVPSFGISFPYSDSGVKVPYVVNTVWKEWEGEFGGSE